MTNIFSSKDELNKHERQPEVILQALRDQIPIGHQLPDGIGWEMWGNNSNNIGIFAFRGLTLDTNSKMVNTGPSPIEGENWLRLAIEIFDRLAVVGPDWRREKYKQDAMSSRVMLCKFMGFDEQDDHRSAKLLEQWFIKSTPLSPAELKEQYLLTFKDDIEKYIDADDIVQKHRSNLRIMRYITENDSSIILSNVTKEYLELDDHLRKTADFWPFGE